MYKGLCDYIMATIAAKDRIDHNELKVELGNAIAKRYNLTVEYEYKISDLDGTGHSRGGRIDMVFYGKKGKTLAIELDRSYRWKSIEKLAKCGFRHKLWICFASKYKPEKLAVLAESGIPICTRFVRLNGVD